MFLWFHLDSGERLLSEQTAYPHNQISDITLTRVAIRQGPAQISFYPSSETLMSAGIMLGMESRDTHFSGADLWASDTFRVGVGWERTLLIWYSCSLKLRYRNTSNTNNVTSQGQKCKLVRMHLEIDWVEAIFIDFLTIHSWSVVNSLLGSLNHQRRALVEIWWTLWHSPNPEQHSLILPFQKEADAIFSMLFWCYRCSDWWLIGPPTDACYYVVCSMHARGPHICASRGLRLMSTTDPSCSHTAYNPASDICR